MRLLYAPLGMLLGVLGSALAERVFRRLWGRVADDPHKPAPKDRAHGWGEVVGAAVVHGAVYGGIKAAMDRAGAAGFARATGAWPGPNGRQPGKDAAL
jgi:hypothetical protein